MKKLWIFLLSVFFAIFCACSSDSSSVSDSDYESETYSVKGTIEVDEENDFFVAYTQDFRELCVKEGFDWNWQNLDLGYDSIYYKYQFNGDTLILFSYEPDDDDWVSTRGIMFLGGSTNKLSGTYSMITCKYDSGIEETTCYKKCDEISGGKMTEEEIEELVQNWFKDTTKNYTYDEMEAVYDSLYEVNKDRLNCITKEDFGDSKMKISGSNVTFSSTYYYKDSDSFDDYTNSEFMYYFYKNLLSRYSNIPSLYRLTEEDSSRVSDILEDSVFEVTSQTKTKATIKFFNQSITVDVKKYKHSEDNREIALDISSDYETCSYLSESGEVSKSTCKNENGEYFETDSRKDGNGTKITYADYYEKSNEDDFDNCVESLLDTIYAKVAEQLGEEASIEDYTSNFENVFSLAKKGINSNRRNLSSDKEKFLKEVYKFKREMKKFSE